MKTGDLVCTKNHKAVGIIERVSKHNVTTHILWNEPPFMQGCNVSTFHINEVEALPQGTRVIKNFKNGVKDELLYNFYDSDIGLIKDITGNNFTAWNLDGSCDLEFEFINDVKDEVNHPSHYTQGNIEVIEYIEDKKLGYRLGNVVKYVSRAGHKDDKLKDLKKAQWYLNREIEKIEEEQHESN